MRYMHKWKVCFSAIKIKWYVCKGTRFFDTCNSFRVFFSLLIRFLINGIGYRQRNLLFPITNHFS